MSQVDRNNPTRGRASASRCWIMEFMEAFPDDATCLDFLWRQRYSEDGRHADCPKCGEERPFHRVRSRPSYCCNYCGHHIHPTAGTIFHRSATSLRLWFYAMYLMTSTKCGVAAKHLERELGVTYKTAWRMANKIRNELMTQDDDTTLSGEVEVDETYVGGKQRRQFGRPGKTSKKTPVVAMAQRGGKVVAKVVPDASARSLLPEIERHVEPGTQVYTDEWRGYASLRKLGYPHRQVRHGHYEYVRGPVFTSTVEGFFGNVENGIAGNYHGVSRKWLQGYVNEYAWRLNHRDDPRADFETLLIRASARQ